MINIIDHPAIGVPLIPGNLHIKPYQSHIIMPYPILSSYWGSRKALSPLRISVPRLLPGHAQLQRGRAVPRAQLQCAQGASGMDFVWEDTHPIFSGNSRIRFWMELPIREMFGILFGLFFRAMAAMGLLGPPRCGQRWPVNTEPRAMTTRILDFPSWESSQKWDLI